MESFAPVIPPFFRRLARGACCITTVAVLDAGAPLPAPRPLGLAYHIAMPEPTSHYFEVEQGRGYTELDVEHAVSEAAGVDLRDWFARYAGGTEAPPFAEALAHVGLKLAVSGDSARRTYTVTPDSNATNEQRVRRTLWLAHDGITSVQ